MTKGKLKTQLRKNRIKQQVKDIATVVAMSATAVFIMVGLVKISLPENNNIELSKNEDIIEDNDINTEIDNEKVNVRKVEQVLVTTQYEDTESNFNENIENTYVDIEGSVENVALIESGTELYATTTVNVRDGASTEANKTGSLNVGNKIVVDKDLGNGWYEITHNDETRYVSSEYFSEDMPLIKVSSTAYWDKYNRRSASGRTLKANHSIAGMVKWLGRSVEVYKCNSDGSAGSYIGTYTFDDTGYGAESGYGSSKILKGRTVGTIENGTCIDFYHNTESECYKYGRRDVYIRFID